MRHLAATAFVVLAVGTVGAAVLALVRKLGRVVQDARARRVEARVRPALIAIAADEDPVPVPWRRSDRRMLVTIAVSLLSKVQGEARAAIVGVLNDAGLPERARKSARGFGAVPRAKAIEALGLIGDASALGLLSFCVADDRDGRVRMAAVRALGRLHTPDAIPCLFDALARVPAGIVGSALLEIGAVGSERFRAGLRDARPGVRALAAEVLGWRGTMGDAAALMTVVMHDSSLDARVRAARALGQLGAPKATGALVACLDPDQPVVLRRVAASALAMLDARSALDPLTRAARQDPDYEVARNAALALTELGRDGRARLEEMKTADGLTSALAHEVIALTELNASFTHGLVEAAVST